MRLADSAAGGYSFIGEEGRPFSDGVVAAGGHELVRVRLRRPLPLERGLELGRRHLESAGLTPAAIAALELRSPAQLDRRGFDAFNRGYMDLLRGLGVAIGGSFPAARTNVVPTRAPVPEPSLYAFTYARPAADPAGRDFVLSGSGEPLKEGGDRARLGSIFGVLGDRARELGVDPSTATTLNLYSPGPPPAGHDEDAAAFAAGAALTWYPSLPPVDDLSYEIDARRLAAEILIG